MPAWTVYVRPGCGLCEELLEALAEQLGAQSADAANLAADVTVIDISGDPALEQRYGHRIPVLLADGDFVCAYHLDSARVAAHLAG